MNRFKNILVYSDASLRSRIALERAAALAEENLAQVTVLSVVEELPRELLQLGAAVDSVELWELAMKERREKLDRLVRRITFPHGGSIVKVLSGTPVFEIIKEVLRQNFDLVMMMADGAGGFREALFGSISKDLMRKCPCPVWVMKAARRKRYARILAAVDLVAAGDEHHSLNVKIVELAGSLARMEGSELHLVHAWMPGFKGTWFDDLTAKRHVVKGLASEVIPSLALKLGVDAIVMGTVCRTGVPGLLIGNTAEKVLQSVSCAVLTVKPEGFVSPVEV